MNKQQLFIIDGVAWQIDRSFSGYSAIPICPKHRMELDVPGAYSQTLRCPDCQKRYEIPRNFSDERIYVIEKFKAISRQDWELIDIDGALTPVTRKAKINEDKYFCTAQLRNSKHGPQVVIYAGEKGNNNKSQIFITPNERRLSFDQKDINPADIFSKIIVEFNDGTKHTIESDRK